MPPSDVLINEYQKYANALIDQTVSDDDKLKYAQEISQNFEVWSI